jgi:hypothetical protein
LNEVVEVIQRELPGVQEPAHGLTNAHDYLLSLAPDVLIELPQPSAAPLISKTNIYHDTVGYVRIAGVEAPLFTAVTNALHTLLSSRSLIGIIVDLRFAKGLDYLTAARVAGLFTSSRGEEIRLGESRFDINPATITSPLPIALLINHDTRGAAEALAGALRATARPSVAIGTNSAGQARVYRSIPLSTGRQLHLAGESVRLPGGASLDQSGLTPDIVVDIPLADERLYFEDEFSRVANGRRLASGPTIRLNEAELVRRRRGLRPPPPQPVDPGPRPVLDPALARGIDVLSGFAADRSAALPGESR